MVLTIPTPPSGFGLTVPSPPASYPAAPAANVHTQPTQPPRVRSFIETTFTVVSTPGAGCWWSEDGDAFVVDEDHMATTCNIKSFIRQCNHYGFTKQRLASAAGGGVLSQFTHPFMKRGRADLLHHIVPKSSSAAAATPAVPAQARKPPAAAEGGLVASLRARVSELEGKLNETEGKLQTLQQLFHRVAGTKRGRNDDADTDVDFGLGLDLTLGLGLDLRLGDVAPSAKRLRTSSSLSSSSGSGNGDGDPDSPTLSAAAASFFGSTSGSSGLFDAASPRGAAFLPRLSSDELFELDDQACQRAPSSTAGGGKSGTVEDDVGSPQGPAPEDSRDFSDSCDRSEVRSEVSDLDSQDPLSLDLDVLAGVMSECSLSLDGGLDEARSLTLPLDLETTDGTTSEGLGDLTAAVHSVGSDNSGIMSAERARGLTRSSSFELMRKLLNALPPASDAATRCSDGGGEGEGATGPSDVEARAQ